MSQTNQIDDTAFREDQEKESEWLEGPASGTAGSICRDLTLDASKGCFAQFLDHSGHLQRLMNCLSSGPRALILIEGPPGVGKTATVQALASAVCENKCPSSIEKNRVLQFSMEGIYAEATYATEVYSRARRLLGDLLREAQQFRHILVYDNFHNLLNYPISSSTLKSEFDWPGLRLIGVCPSDMLQHLTQKYRFIRELFTTIQITPPPSHDLLAILRARLVVSDADADPATLEAICELASRFICYQAEPGRSERILLRILEEMKSRSAPRQITIDAVRDALCSIVHVPREMLILPQRHVLGMEAFLNQRVLGQPEAVAQVCKRLVVTKSRTTVTPDRPDGVFLFAGPTGVGKTELAKSISEYLTGNPSNIIRLDMSAYSDPGSIRRLLGTPETRGDVLHSAPETPLLTREIWDKSHGVLLLDEIEKAHPEVRLLFLHGIDTGIMHDNLGTTLYLGNLTVIMTTNIGFSGQLAVVSHPGQSEREKADFVNSAAMEAIRQNLPPEFLGRLDAIVFFNPLSPHIMKGFVKQKVSLLESQIGIPIRLDKNSADLLLEKGFSNEYGARHLNRIIDEYLGYPIALLRQESNWPMFAMLKVTRQGRSDNLIVKGMKHDK